MINVSLHLLFIKVLCSPPMTLDVLSYHLEGFSKHVKDCNDHRHAVLFIEAEQLSQHFVDTWQRPGTQQNGDRDPFHKEHKVLIKS
jgi:hypothetical protein